MASSHRRKVRRFLLGASIKARGVWWIGRVTVRVMTPYVKVSTRSVREKAHNGAEKSSVSQPESTCGLRSSDLQAGGKSLHARKVNHMGRKHIWAQRLSNSLRRDCEKLNKFPRGHLGPHQTEVLAARRKVKAHCMAKWSRLHMQCTVMGIPLVTAPHESFWKYLLVETSRGGIGDWDMLLTGLPRAGDSASQQFQPLRTPLVKRHQKRGEASGPNRACRMCGYFGKGPHAWNSCGRPTGVGGGGPSRKRTGPRRCDTCGAYHYSKYCP